MNARKLLITGLLLATASATHAQRWGGIGFYAPGVMVLMANGLENQPSQPGLPALDPDPAGVAFRNGGGGFATFGRLVMSLEGYGLGFGEETQGDVRLRRSGGGGQIGTGFAVVNTADWHVFPQVAVGVLSVVTEAGNRGAEVVRFGDTPIAPTNQGAFSLTQGYFEVSLRAHRLFMAPSGGGFTVGLAAGYAGSLGAERWQNDVTERPVGEIDEGRLGGFFLALSLGGGQMGR